MIVIGVSLVANVFILAYWQTSKEEKWEQFFPQIPCALNCQLIRQKKKLGEIFITFGLNFSFKVVFSPD
jgi:hypothetical protein